jgi:hypothetical protein
MHWNIIFEPLSQELLQIGVFETMSHVQIVKVCGFFYVEGISSGNEGFFFIAGRG